MEINVPVISAKRAVHLVISEVERIDQCDGIQTNLVEQWHDCIVY